MIKINVGCGHVYKPGYVNIDKFETSVTDKVCDASDLPFESNSIELIEAFQLLEHFDAIHCKYVLSEWFRVLEPEGTLIIETPDLEKTFKKFLSSDVKTKKKTLQWIYGIQSLGMEHKTGFTFQLLRDYLEEIGFVEIVRNAPRTHTYEPGMRIVCKKPKKYLAKQLQAQFRQQLTNKLTNDSFLLIPLENWLSKIFNSYTTLKEIKGNINMLNEVLSKTVLCHPYVPLTFLKEGIHMDLWKKKEVKTQLDLLNQFVETNIHKKLFTLWMKRKKNARKIKQEFQEFIQHITAKMRDTFKKGNLRRVEYLLTLDQTNIPLFDFNIISEHAIRHFNIGVKQFHKEKLSEAFKNIKKTIKINPKNPLAYWNLAKLRILLNHKKSKIIQEYEKAYTLMKNKKYSKKIKKESNYIKNDKLDAVKKEPVSNTY